MCKNFVCVFFHRSCTRSNLFQLVLFLQYFQYILQRSWAQLIYLLTPFCTYKFYSLNARYKITGFITFTLTTTRIPNKSFIAYAFINRFFAFTPASIIIPTLFIITNTMLESTFKFTCFMPFYAFCFISS